MQTESCTHPSKRGTVYKGLDTTQEKDLHTGSLGNGWQVNMQCCICGAQLQGTPKTILN